MSAPVFPNALPAPTPFFSATGGAGNADGVLPARYQSSQRDQQVEEARWLAKHAGGAAPVFLNALPAPTPFFSATGGAENADGVLLARYQSPQRDQQVEEARWLAEQAGGAAPAAHSAAGGGGGGAGFIAAAPAAAPASATPAGAARALVGRCVDALDHGSGGVLALAMVEGAGLVGGGHDHIRAWAQGAVRGLKSIAGKVSTINSIAALPGGRFAAASGPTKLAEVWDAGTGQRLHQLGGHTSDVKCVAALPGGHLASGSKDKTVRIWNAATGAHVATLEGHTWYVFALAALPDGRLASGSYDNTIRLWDVTTRACTQVLRHPHSVFTLAVLDGGRLASGCGDNRVYIWSHASGVQEAVLEGHTHWVVSLAALPNGLLASGSNDKTVRVWDVGARACVAVLERHRGGVTALAALPDGRLASGAESDPLIRVWTLSAPGSPEDAAAAEAEARRAAAEVLPALPG